MEEDLKNNLDINEGFKSFYIENDENILSYAKKVEDIEDYWNKYFEDSLVKLNKEVVNDVNIKEEDIEKEYLSRMQKLKEKTIQFMNRDIEVFLKEVKK